MVTCALLQVYGVLTWRGKKADKPQLISGRSKSMWRWMPSKEQLAVYQPLARELQRQTDLQRLAAQKAAAPAKEHS